MGEIVNKSDLMVFYENECVREYAETLAEHLRSPLTDVKKCDDGSSLFLCVADDGLRLECGGQSMRCDLMQQFHRLKRSNLSGELLVKASKIKNADRIPTVIDATAGLGEDSLLLAAAGFSVKLYERNPVIAVLLKDAVKRASEEPELCETVKNMQVFEADSIAELRRLTETPDVVFLDPMFPEKTKTALAKKKFQLLHRLELPCADENDLLQAAFDAKPHKIVIKRPIKGPYLGNRKPDYSLKGKAIRYDCIIIA